MKKIDMKWFYFGFNELVFAYFVINQVLRFPSARSAALTPMQFLPELGFAVAGVLFLVVEKKKIYGILLNIINGLILAFAAIMFPVFIVGYFITTVPLATTLFLAGGSAVISVFEVFSLIYVWKMLRQGRQTPAAEETIR